ncbi:MAG: dephospho-CoA kinase [Mangrovibacterium sp.]
MIKLGITGGIGSGKSTICHIFRILGIPIYESDARAKTLMDNSPIIQIKIKNTFGESIYREDGSLDRKKLANLVFNSPSLLDKLNEIVHPEVRKDFISWVNEQVSTPYVIQESAILFESGLHQIMDKTLTVAAPLSTRIERVIKRDQVSKKQVLERINNQMSDEQRIALADFSICNGEKDLIVAQILKIDKILQHG